MLTAHHCSRVRSISTRCSPSCRRPPGTRNKHGATLRLVRHHELLQNQICQATEIAKATDSVSLANSEGDLRPAFEPQRTTPNALIAHCFGAPWRSAMAIAGSSRAAATRAAQPSACTAPRGAGCEGRRTHPRSVDETPQTVGMACAPQCAPKCLLKTRSALSNGRESDVTDAHMKSSRPSR